MENRRTPLYDFHIANGARMVPFAGWDMPVQYPAGIKAEHLACRNGAALFDVSHMGRFKLTGSGARRLLERTLTRRVSDMEPGKCRYSMVCNEKGEGVVYAKPNSKGSMNTLKLSKENCYK